MEKNSQFQVVVGNGHNTVSPDVMEAACPCLLVSSLLFLTSEFKTTVQIRKTG